MEALAIFIGGGLGSLSRYGMARWLGNADGGFPLGTLAANVAACIILGIMGGILLQKAQVPRAIQFGAMTGFCGGFSTFSTFSGESVALFETGKAGLGALYIALSLLLCVGGIVLGRLIGQSIA